MQRRRFATRAELIDRLAALVDKTEVDPAAISTVLDALAGLGVDVEALVKIVVIEPDGCT